MPLVNMQDMLAHAYRHKYAVGAFDLVSLDFLEAIVQGAHNRRAPVILSLAESHFEYFDFELASSWLQNLGTKWNTASCTTPIKICATKIWNK